MLLGSNLIYTLMVINKGPSAGTGVTVTDILPDGVRFVSSSTTKGDCSGTSTVTCTIGALAGGDNAIVTIVGIPTVVGTITNTASVIGNERDPDTGDNTSTDITTVDPAADLSLTKSDAPDPVLVGGELTYTIIVTNKGPSTGMDVTLTDTLFGDLRFVSATASQGSCSGTATVTCSLGSLASGDRSTVTIVIVPTAVGTITDTVSVTSDGADPATGDNTATETTTVDPAADLSVAKSDSPDPVLVGGKLTYTLTVINKGPSYATGVTLTDTLAGSVRFVSSTPSQGRCSGTNTVTCTLGNFASGDSATVAIVVTPTAAGTITNTARVTGNETDPGTGDNTAQEATTVRPTADLSVTKSDSSDPILIGSNLTYTFTISNEGPSDATGVRLTDTLPEGVTFVSSTPSQGSCSGTSTVVCSLGNIRIGDGATVSIVVTPVVVGTITNTAIVSGNEGDRSKRNNSASETTTVNPAADLSLTKAASHDPAVIGNGLTYTLTVTNNGPSDATNVTLTDPLPQGVDLVSVSEHCVEAEGTVTCNWDSLASGDRTVAAIVVTPNLIGDLTNSARVTSSVPDPNPSDNASTQNYRRGRLPLTSPLPNQSHLTQCLWGTT